MDTKYTIGRTNVYVEFIKDNGIPYYQDHRFFNSIPHGVKFYPVAHDDTSIKFVADGYGIMKDNSYGLEGNYGSGSIWVDKTDIDHLLVEFCAMNILLPV